MSRTQLKKITPRGWGKKSTGSLFGTVQNRLEAKQFYTLKTKAWKYSNIPKYQVQEYSNDRYDSGVRVKSGYRLYIGLYTKR